MNARSYNKLYNIISNLQNAKRVEFSDKFYRDYKCVLGCGACCFKFSLDYYDGTKRWEKFKKTYPKEVSKFKLIEHEGVKIYSYNQDDNKDNYCGYLNKKTGACGIHKASPLSCSHEPLKFMYNSKEDKVNIIIRPFGRAWNMTRIDGKKGAMCEFYNTLSNESANHYKEIINEFKELMKAYGFDENKMPKIKDLSYLGTQTKINF